jgi:hypothetical protein
MGMVHFGASENDEKETEKFRRKSPYPPEYHEGSSSCKA